MEEQEEDYSEQPKGKGKGNVLPLWGNERSMNMNPLILTNIQASHYFKVNLYELKTYHEVIDEIYYKVAHLEPWEKGSRKTSGQTGMCGGVRGVGAGGIVSTAYCLLYKLFTLRLTRKQLNGLINHADSPYIRALGFMYIRYTQPPPDLYDWYDEYLEDEEVLDVKAGGGQSMTIGDMLRAFLTKLEWFSTLFPRIPVPIQQKIEKKMNERFPPQPVIRPIQSQQTMQRQQRHFAEQEEINARGSSRSNDRWNERSGGHRERSPIRDRDRDRYRERHEERDDRRERHDDRRERDTYRDREMKSERDSYRDRDVKSERDGYRDKDKGERSGHRGHREHRHREERSRYHR